MIIIVNSKNNKKRSTPSIYQKKKKTIKGFVDRITNGIVVVVVRNPEEPDKIKEIFVPVSNFAKRIPEEGDYVSVTITV